MPDPLGRLETWYRSQCNGDWEHGAGIQIETIDNPGWSLTVDLEHTALDGHAFPAVEERYDSESEWLRCWVEDNQFEGAGGPGQLSRMIELFLEWAEKAPSADPRRAS